MRPTPPPQTRRAIRASLLALAITMLAVVGNGVYLRATAKPEDNQDALTLVSISDPAHLGGKPLSATEVIDRWSETAKHAPNECILISYDDLRMLNHKLESQERQRKQVGGSARQGGLSGTR